jgi:hypothetical protein
MLSGMSWPKMVQEFLQNKNKKKLEMLDMVAYFMRLQSRMMTNRNVGQNK